MRSGLLTRALLFTAFLFAGAVSFPGCADEAPKTAQPTGTAPQDNDEAARQKQMQDFMEAESKKK